MSSQLWNNFVGMPPLLKLVTVSCVILAPMTVFMMIVTNSPISIFGRKLPIGAWWYSGGGPITILVAIILYRSGVLILKRNARGRLVYVIAGMLMTISVLIVAERLNIFSIQSKVAFISSLVLTTALALYLYISPTVRRYFRSQ